MPTTAPAAPAAIYYQAADHSLRYAHNGHPVPDDADTWRELTRRGLVRANGHARIVDHNAVTGELLAAAYSAPVLPVCGPCGGVGMPPGRDPAAGRTAPPVEQRCPDCTGSGRAPATITVGRVQLDPSDDPTAGHVETWHGCHPSDGAGLFLLCDAPQPLRDPARPWSFVVWPGWEDGWSSPRGAWDGPTYPTRAAAVAALGAACRARYGPAWDHEPHHSRETFDPAGRGMWRAECTRCPWRSPTYGPDAQGSHRRDADAHAADERAAHLARAAGVEQAPAAAVEREPVGATPAGA